MGHLKNPYFLQCKGVRGEGNVIKWSFYKNRIRIMSPVILVYLCAIKLFNFIYKLKLEKFFNLVLLSFSKLSCERLIVWLFNFIFYLHFSLCHLKSTFFGFYSETHKYEIKWMVIEFKPLNDIIIINCEENNANVSRAVV